MEDLSAGTWLKRRRKALDLTQQDLAVRVGCAPITIAKIEAEERRPSRQIAVLLAQHLQVPVGQSELFIRILRGQENAGQLGKIGLPGAPGLPPQAAHPQAEPELARDGGMRAADLLGRISHTRLVGRQPELALALHTWQSACSGQAQTLLIQGEPGIGKSRLAQELLNAVQAGQGICFVGNCFSSGERSYAPFARMIQGLPEFPQGLPEVALADLKVIAPQLETRFPQALNQPALDPLAEQLRLFESLYLWFVAAAAGRPIAILVEDIHWADTGSLELIKALARRFQQTRMPALIILTARDENPSGSQELPALLHELLRQHRLASIHIKRLDQVETGEFLHTIFQQAITGEFSALIYRETQGTPFFIQEACKDMLERGDIYWTQDHWERKALPDLHVPRSVQFAILARLENLPVDGRTALSMAAILGRRFEFNLLQAALDLDEDTLIEALETARQAQFIVEAGSPGGSFEFAHNLIAAVLVEAAGSLRRRKLHLRAAAALEKIHPAEYSQLAYHCQEAADAPRALRYYRLAAERAMQAYDHEQAVHDYTRALAHVGQDRRQACSLHLSRARVFDLRGQRPAQADDLQFAGALADQLEAIELQAEVALAFAEYYIQVSDPGNVIEQVQQAIRLSRQAGRVEIEAQACLLWGRALTETGDLPEARQCLEKAGELGRTAGLGMIEMRSLINLGNVDYLMGNYTAAQGKYAGALVVVRRLGERRIESMTLNNLGNVAWAMGQLDVAVSLYEQSRAITHLIGDRLNEARSLSNLGSILTEQYQYPQALEQLEQALHLFRELNQRLDEEIVLGHLSDVMEALGRYTEARSYREQAIAGAQEINDPQGESAMRCALGRVLIYQGDLEAACAAARQAVALGQAQGFRVEESQAWQVLGLACFMAGQFQAAETAYQAALALAEALGQPQKLQEFQAELARLSELCGDHALARQRLSLATLEVGPGQELVINDPTLCLCAGLVLAPDDPATANHLLKAGYNRLQATAAKIPDLAARRHYLEMIPNHQALTELWRRQANRQAGSFQAG